MKQKKIGTDLYVFDTSAYQITKDLDVENIYIQQELIPGYEKLNSSSVNAKIKPINYKLNIIQKPVWGDYIYADEEKQDVSAVWKWGSTGTEIDPPIIVKGINNQTDSFECYNIDMEEKVSYDTANYEILDPSIGKLNNESGVLSVTGKKIGQTKVKAIWPEDSSYNAGSSEIAVKVSPVAEITISQGGKYGYVYDGGEIAISNDVNNNGGAEFRFYDASTVPHTYISSYTVTSSNTGIVSLDKNSGENDVFMLWGPGKCTITVEWPEQTTTGIGQANGYDISAGSMSFDISTLGW